MGKALKIMVVWQLKEVVNPLMVSVVNNIYGTNLKEGATFMDFYKSRGKSRGYLKKKEGLQVWIAPMIDHGFSTSDKKMVQFLTVEEYQKLEFDPEPENI